MTRMTAEEVFEEVEWLREAGLHPAVIAAQIGRSPMALEKLARRYGRMDIHAFFDAEAKRTTKEWRASWRRREREKRQAEKASAETKETAA